MQLVRTSLLDMVEKMDPTILQGMLLTRSQVLELAAQRTLHAHGLWGVMRDMSSKLAPDRKNMSMELPIFGEPTVIKGCCACFLQSLSAAFS